MERLGGSVIPISEVKYSSVSKGESLPDTIRTLECYADVIVLRHPETGSAAIAAKARKEARHQRRRRSGRTSHSGAARHLHHHGGIGRLDNLTVTMLGDLKYGRTVHSLARLLSNFRYQVELRLAGYFEDAQGSDGGSRPKECTAGGILLLEKVLPETDILYVTRVQKERFEDPADYEKVKGAYVIDPEIMKAAKKEMAVMHPLPRVGEISPDFDDDPRAAYFRQMEYGCM
jgi:aspartate carbamoyltransferase catalytic subunit